MNKTIIGIDVGGTYIRAVKYQEDKNGALIEVDKCKSKFVYIEDPKLEFNINVMKVIDQYIQHNSNCFVGLSMAALVDKETGVVKYWPNNKRWNGLNIYQLVHSKYNVQMCIEDDANCGAIGELYLRNLQGNIIYISLGTGVGSGIILNNKLYKGDRGFGGEIGHVVVNAESDLYCVCGLKGCLQAYMSFSSILQSYNTIKEKDYSFEEYIKFIKDGDLVANDLFMKYIKYLKIIIFNLIMIFDIYTIIIGGGISKLLLNYLGDIQDDIKKNVLRFGKDISISISEDIEFIGAIGAAYLVREEYRF